MPEVRMFTSSARSRASDSSKVVLVQSEVFTWLGVGGGLRPLA